MEVLDINPVSRSSPLPFETCTTEVLDINHTGFGQHTIQFYSFRGKKEDDEDWNIVVQQLGGILGLRISSPDWIITYNSLKYIGYMLSIDIYLVFSSEVSLMRCVQLNDSDPFFR